MPKPAKKSDRPVAAKKAQPFDPSKPLPNQRQELFAQHLSRGLPAVEAYERAGYKRNEGNASELKGKEKVSARVAHLLAQAAKAAVMDRATIMRKLAHNVDRAEQLGQINASTTALKLYGQEAHGMFVEKRINFDLDIDKMNEQQLRQVLGMSAEDAQALIEQRRKELGAGATTH